jgi:DNA-binding HxlR family transcriptional regulator
MAGNPRTNRSKSDRPIVQLLAILGQRWALRVMWELRHAPITFRELRERCDDISPTVLNTRLKTLRENGLVDLSDDGYVYTPLGRELGDRVSELDRFAKRWVKRSAKRA